MVIFAFHARLSTPGSPRQVWEIVSGRRLAFCPRSGPWRRSVRVKMTYVLVHGAWAGAHGFRRVRPLLQAHGHAVFTPSLTGIGERSHLDHGRTSCAGS